MSTITSTSTSHIHRNSLLRSIVLGGLIIGIADAIIYHWLVSSVLGGYPLIAVYQYMASGALGNAAFAGGIATALRHLDVAALEQLRRSCGVIAARLRRRVRQRAWKSLRHR